METAADPNLLTALRQDIQNTRTSKERRKKLEEYFAAMSELSPSPGARQLIQSIFAVEPEVSKRVAALAGEPNRISLDELIASHVRVHGEAIAQLYREPMLNATAVAKLLGSRTKNPRELVMRLRRASELLAVPKGQHHVYPAFQFNLERQQVYEVVKTVAKLLDAASDPWGVVSWWLTPNARLRNTPSPRDLLGQPDGAEIIEQLAKAAIEDVG